MVWKWPTKPAPQISTFVAPGIFEVVDGWIYSSVRV